MAEGLCDLAIVRAPLDLKPWAHALIGYESRFVVMAADDPWARRRHIRLDEIPTRTLAIDHRTGTTTLDLWPEHEHPAIKHTRNVDDWLIAISTGRCIGITPESTVSQYQRTGIAYRPLRDAAPLPVYLLWRTRDFHPATHTAIALAETLYQDDQDGSKS